MKKRNLFSACSICKFRVHKGSVNEAEILNLLNRQFNEHHEYAAVASALTYVRVNYKWNYLCLLVDLFNHEITGYSAGAVNSTIRSLMEFLTYLISKDLFA